MPLIGGRCQRCGLTVQPLRHACRRCGGPLLESILGGRGRLYAWTIVRAAAEGFDPPYALGYVLLDDGPRVLARLDGWEEWLADAQIGDLLIVEVSGEGIVASARPAAQPAGAR
jgi:uncharacterized OB-fold protein